MCMHPMREETDKNKYRYIYISNNGDLIVGNINNQWAKIYTGGMGIRGTKERKKNLRNV